MLGDPDIQKKIEQYQKVKAFFADFRDDDGALTGGILDYETPEDFRATSIRGISIMLPLNS